MTKKIDFNKLKKKKSSFISNQGGDHMHNTIGRKCMFQFIFKYYFLTILTNVVQIFQA